MEDTELYSKIITAITPVIEQVCKQHAAEHRTLTQAKIASLEASRSQLTSRIEYLTGLNNAMLADWVNMEASLKQAESSLQHYQQHAHQVGKVFDQYDSADRALSEVKKFYDKAIQSQPELV